MSPSPRKHDTVTAASARRSKRVAVVALAAMLHVMLPQPIAFAHDFRHWSPAVSVDPERQNGINTSVNDGCPIEAPDGHMLFFASNRANATGTNLDIWVAYRETEDSPFGDPEPLPGPINTPAAEFCPTPLPGNQLLFVSTRPNPACGWTTSNPDIYYTRLQMTPLGWTEPVPLACGAADGINSAGEEFSPSVVQAEGQTHLFFSSNRDAGTVGVHKIYWSTLLPDGTWSPAQKVDELNSTMSDARPNVRADGLEIVFDSNRGGTYDIYVATRHRITSPWSSPRRLRDHVNSDTADETRASLSRDGTRLYFGSTRANAELGGQGADIYVSTRSGPGWHHRE